MITLRDCPVTGTFDAYLRLLEDSRNRMLNLNALFPSPEELRNGYLDAVDLASRAVFLCMPSEDVDRIFFNDRYYTVLSAPCGSPEITKTIQMNIRYANHVLEELVQSIRTQVQYWQQAPGQLVLPDTNYFVGESRRYADEVDFCRTFGLPEQAMTLIIPVAVIDELDGLKKHTANRTDQAARAALKFIEQVAGSADSPPGLLHEPSVTRIGGVRVSVVMDAPTHRRLLIMDDEIVGRAETLQRCLGRSVITASHETTGFALRARSRGLMCRKPDMTSTESD